MRYQLALTTPTISSNMIFGKSLYSTMANAISTIHWPKLSWEWRMEWSSVELRRWNGVSRISDEGETKGLFNSSGKPTQVKFFNCVWLINRVFLIITVNWSYVRRIISAIYGSYSLVNVCLKIYNDVIFIFAVICNSSTSKYALIILY
jgi:hypothetical protein